MPIAQHDHSPTQSAPQHDDQLHEPQPTSVGQQGQVPDIAAATSRRQQVGSDGADRLSSSGGREWLVGGRGNDTYVVDDEHAAVLERQDEGWDTIRASVSFKLTKYVERLELVGSADIYGAGNTGNDRLIGNAGNNRLNGFKGNDSIDGGAGDDTLHGDRGDDRLVGGAGDDYLDGGFGNDVLIGGRGNDTYELRRAMGQDYVYDKDDTPGNVDTILVTTALNPGDIEVMRDGDDLLLRIRHTTSGMRIGNWFGAPRFRIERVKFNDGTVWNASELEASAERHHALATDLRFGQGWAANIARQQQAFSLGQANGAAQRKRQDSIFNYGTPPPDTMTMKRGGAINMILPAPLWTQQVDMIKIDADINPADLKLMRDHDDLILLATGATIGFLRVRQGFDRARIEFADGTVWDNAGIRERLRPTLREGGFVQRSPLENVIGGAFYGYEDSNDVLEGSREGDWMFGYGGDDILNGHDGRDNMFGGAGDDCLSGGSHADIMHGGQGDDFMDGGRGADYMDGGAGDDILVGGSGDDVVDGGGGNDRIDGGGGNDVLHGGAGDDMMRGGGGNDLLYGGAGADTYYLEAGMGRDVVDEGGDRDGSGNTIDVAIELRPSDITLQRVGRDLVLGIGDMFNALTLKDAFDGGRPYIEAAIFGDGRRWNFAELERRAVECVASAGDDILHGRGGARWWDGNALDADIHDVINGRDGADELYGHAGNDLLLGGAGDDLIVGGPGSDLLAGNPGRDRLVAGGEGDIIVFNRGDGNDTVAFDAGTVAPAAGGTTVSLGGVRGDQLSLRKSGDDLVLDLDAGDSISFENWYGLQRRPRGTQLQMVLDSANDWQSDAEDVSRTNRIALFDFDSMVAQYDRARSDLPGLDLWSVAAALTHHRLRGSDSMAIGGELAYHYAHYGRWNRLGPEVLSAGMVNQGFGSSDQAIAR